MVDIRCLAILGKIILFTAPNVLSPRTRRTTNSERGLCSASSSCATCLASSSSPTLCIFFPTCSCVLATITTMCERLLKTPLERSWVNFLPTEWNWCCPRCSLRWKKILGGPKEVGAGLVKRVKPSRLIFGATNTCAKTIVFLYFFYFLKYWTSWLIHFGELNKTQQNKDF